MADLKLDNLVRILNERKNPAISNGRQAFADEFAREYASAKAMTSVFERLGQPHVTPEELNAGIERLASGLVGLAKKVEASKADNGPVLQAIKALETGVNRLASAVSAIRLPEVSIPELPAHPPVDMTPVLDALDGIYRVLAQMQAEEAEDEAEPEKPKEWVFEVKRNQAGFVRTIEARQV